jgi:hypothetical protein
MRHAWKFICQTVPRLVLHWMLVSRVWTAPIYLCGAVRPLPWQSRCRNRWQLFRTKWGISASAGSVCGPCEPTGRCRCVTGHLKLGNSNVMDNVTVREWQFIMPHDDIARVECAVLVISAIILSYTPACMHDLAVKYWMLSILVKKILFSQRCVYC